MKFVATKHEKKLAQQLLTFIDKNKKVSWQQISAHVTGELGWQIRTGGWLGVRGALQRILNSGQVERTDNIRAEEYVSLPYETQRPH